MRIFNFLLPIISFVLIGCNIPNNQNSKPLPTPKPTIDKSAERITAFNLMGIYKWNYKEGDREFKGKTIVVDGIVDDVTSKFFDLKGDKGAAVVRVYLKSNIRLSESTIGKNITIQGRCTGGVGLTVTIEDADIIE